MTCSLCGEPAVVQWQRLPGLGEAEAHAEDTQAARHFGAEQNRHRQRVIIRELMAMMDDPDFDPKKLPTLERQIAKEKQHLDGITDPEPLPTATVLLAVFACKDHAISRDEAARLHQSGCLSSASCSCLTDDPVTVPHPPEPVDYFKD